MRGMVRLFFGSNVGRPVAFSVASIAPARIPGSAWAMSAAQAAAWGAEKLVPDSVMTPPPIALVVMALPGASRSVCGLPLLKQDTWSAEVVASVQICG